MSYQKRFFYSLIAFLMMSFGISLQFKAAVGQSILNAFVLTVYDISGIEIGNILNILNLSFFVIYLWLRKSGFHIKDMMQLVMTLLNGVLINFYVYTVLRDVVLTEYWMQVLVFLMGLCLSSVSLGAILAFGVVTFPLESLCLVISRKTNRSLSFIRLSADAVILLATFVLFFIFETPLYIREGTLISFFLLSVLMGHSYDAIHLKIKETV